MKRTLIIGDQHGQLEATLEALKRAQYDPQQDRIINLGDICDRGPHSARLAYY